MFVLGESRHKGTTRPGVLGVITGNAAFLKRSPPVEHSRSAQELEDPIVRAG